MKFIQATIISLALGFVGVSSATAETAPNADPIHIDIPVPLKQANVVFNMDHLAFLADLPFGMNYMHLLAMRMKKDAIKGKIIGVFQTGLGAYEEYGIFHGDAAYMTLNDKAYDAERHVTTGNPYAKTIAGLQNEGVQIEECAVSMKGHHWGNADLLPGVLVNAGAVGRIVQLVQEGYVQIQP